MGFPSLRITVWMTVAGLCAHPLAAEGGKLAIACDKTWGLRLFEDLPGGRKVNFYDQQTPGRGIQPKGSLGKRTDLLLLPGHWYILEPVGFRAGQAVALRLSDPAGLAYLFLTATVDERNPSRFASFQPKVWFHKQDRDADPEVLDFTDRNKGLFYDVFDEAELKAGTLRIKKNALAIPGGKAEH